MRSFKPRQAGFLQRQECTIVRSVDISPSSTQQPISSHTTRSKILSGETHRCAPSDHGHLSTRAVGTVSSSLHLQFFFKKDTFYERGRPLALYLTVQVTSGDDRQIKEGNNTEPTRRMHVMQRTQMKQDPQEPNLPHVLICFCFFFDQVYRRRRRCSISKRNITRASASVATRDVRTV